jgi:RHS repeat-associated protein
MHQDPVAKSKRVTDGSGTVVSTIELDPWGGETNRSISEAFQPRKFTTYEQDSIGSHDAMHRRYNRWWARFEQPDPYGGSYDLTNPQSFNRYSYVQNDPVNFVDPTGLWGQGEGGTDPTKLIMGRSGGIFGGSSGGFYFGSGWTQTAFNGGNGWEYYPARYYSYLLLFPGGLVPNGSGSVGQRYSGGGPQDPRPKKDPVVVLVVEKKRMTCVEREWQIFARKVQAVKDAAEAHFNEMQLPWWIQLLKGIAEGIGGDPRGNPIDAAEEKFKDEDIIPTLINFAARDAEIREGTRREEKARDDAIQKNCTKK